MWLVALESCVRGASNKNHFYQNHQHIFGVGAIYGSLDRLKYRICCFGDMFFSEKQYFPCHEVNIRMLSFRLKLTKSLGFLVGKWFYNRF